MDSPLVSILMSTFNSERYISEAVSSILDQSYGNWELLIADDCSNDNTLSIINTFDDQRIRTFHNKEHLHYLRTRNKLIKEIRGAYTTLLDSDDYCDKDRIKLQVEAFQNDPDLVLVGTQIEYVNVNGELIKGAPLKPTSYSEILEKIETENVFTGSTIMVKSNLLQELGGYRDYFSGIGYEDYDLTSRIVEKHKAKNLPQKLYMYRQYSESFTKNNLVNNPFKLHGHLLIQKFIQERKEGGKDSLEKNDIPGIIEFILDKHKPYNNDPSMIYRHMMWSNLNKKLYLRSLKSILSAIWIRPFKLSNWKTFLLLGLISLKIIKG